MGVVLELLPWRDLSFRFKEYLAFSKKPFPTFTFKAGKNFIEREIFMVKGMPGVFCVYRLKDGAGLLSREGFTLTLRPLCNSRFYHYIAKEGLGGLQEYTA